MNEQTIIEQYLHTVIKSCGQIHQDEIAEIYHVLLKVARNKGNIYLCGNGGSSSTASHFQSDLNRAFAISCQTMPAVCLTDNIAALTAVANDVSYEDVFCHQLKYQLEGRDVLVAVSASGNSANVIKAAEFAKEKGSIVIALVGFDGGRLKTISDYAFHVPVCNMQVVEDLQLLFCHLVSTLIREEVEG